MNVLRKVKAVGISVGLILIALGLLLAFMPRQVQLILNTFAGIIFIILGASGIIRGLTMDRGQNKFVNLLIGVSILLASFGILVFLNPDITLFMVGMFVAVLAIGTGLENIVTSISIRKDDERASALLIFGLIHFVFGCFMAWNTFKTMLLIVMIVGIYMIVYGVSLIASININVAKVQRRQIQEKGGFDYDYDVDKFEQTNEDIK